MILPRRTPSWIELKGWAMVRMGMRLIGEAAKAKRGVTRQAEELYGRGGACEPLAVHLHVV